MMSDVGKNYRNSTRAGGHQRTTAPRACGRNHVAAHVSRTAISQLSPVLLGPTRLAHRHVDAADGDELVRLSNHELEIIAWPGGCRRLCTHGALVGVGRRVG